MRFAWTTAFATDGAPMLVGDARSAAFWRGGEDDGTGVVVTFWGVGLEKLPAKFLRAKKTTKRGETRAMKLASSEEAAAFESELSSAFLVLHPGAARPPQYPEYPVWYRGDYMNNERVFGIDRKLTSAYDAMLKKLRGEVASVVIDKRSKAKALFFEMEGGGGGLVGVDTERGVLAIAKLTATRGTGEPALAPALERTDLAALEPSGKIALGETAVAFPSAWSAARIAQHNWAAPDFLAGVTRARAEHVHAPLRGPDQAAPVGACVSLRPGTYHYAVDPDGDAAGGTYRALFVWA